MLTQQDCLRKAFQCLLDGDTAGRDYWCKVSESLIKIQDRLNVGGPLIVGELIAVTVPEPEGKVLCLPDLSHEKLQ